MRITLSIVFICFAIQANGQDPTDIFLFDLDVDGQKLSLSNGKNFTRRAGYDNQPFFHPTQPIIFYSSFNDQGRSEIKRFNYQTNQTSQVTETTEREYSPTVTPDQKFLSCIIQRDDGKQDLGKYPIDGGEAIVLIDDLMVGYHVWINPDELLLFVLGDSAMTLRHYDLSSGQDKIIAENIGRALHPIPGQAAISFVDKNSDDRWVIMRFDTENGSLDEMAPTLPGHEDLAWTPDGNLIMSDGQQIYVFDPGAEADWEPIDMGDAELKGITRLAISKDGKKLAVVAEE